jgi:hypothetical protein
VLDPLFEPSRSTDKNLFSALKEKNSISHQSAEEDPEKDVYVAAGLGDDGNVSIIKKKDKRTDHLRRKGIKN